MKPIGAIVCVLAAAALAGCGKPARAPSAPAVEAREKPVVEERFLTVLDDSTELEAARRLVVRAAPAPLSAAVLADTWYLSRAAVPTNLPREQAIAQLLGVARDGQVADHARGNAACLLAFLDPPQGERLILEFLQGGDAKLRAAVLQSLSLLDAGDAFRIANSELAAALLALLADAENGLAAVSVCAEQELPGAVDVLWRLLPGAVGPQKADILYGLARLQPDRRAFTACAEGLSATNSRAHDRCLSILETFFTSPDAALALEATELVATDLLRMLAAGKTGWLDFPQSACHAVLQRGTGPKTRELAEAVLAQSRDPVLHAYAYVAARRLEGAEGRRRILRDLGDPQRSKWALQAARTLFKGTADAEIAGALARQAAQEMDPAAVAGLARALLAVGGEAATAEATALAARLPEPGRTSVLREASREEPLAMARRLAAVGLIDAGRLDDIVAKVQAWRAREYGDEAEPRLDAGEFLTACGVILTFDVETDEIPVRHDQLIAELAGISGGVFQPLAGHEQRLAGAGPADGGEASYQVQFIHGGRLYRFTARDFGDWYDVERVLRVCNQAVADAGTPSRFMALAGDGQCASVVFIAPAQAQVLAGQFQLSFEQSLNAPMESGKAFEATVRESLAR